MGTNATLRAAVYGRESQANTKSIDDQVAIGETCVDALGWRRIESFDDGSSASRYATKERPGWDKLLSGIQAGRFDVVVLWDVTRGDREPVRWLTLLEICRERGVLVHVIADERTYDPRRARDYKDLATAGVDAGYETDRTSERTLRGVVSAAKNGRPAMGRVPYGYRRIYDPQSGKLAGQEPDPDTAPIVADVFDRAARGESLESITWQAGWPKQTLYDRLRNPAYAGIRIHRKQGRNGNPRHPETFPGSWQPIVEPERFYAVQTILDSHQGAGMRPARQRHLLSGIATCHRGHPLRARPGRYVCAPGCVGVSEAGLDELVEATMVEALASDELYDELVQADEASDAEARAARNDEAKLRARLDDYRARMRRGAIDPDDFAAIAEGLKADIEAATQRAERASIPPALRPFLEPGTDVEARWEDATLQARRDVIRALAEIVVHPTGRRRLPVAERVSITPLELQP